MKQIEQLIEEELARALAGHGPAHSSHEAWALLYEEVQEAEAELKTISQYTSSLWHNVKANDKFRQGWAGCDPVYKHAIKLIAEAIQVAAMARKFEQYLERGKGNA